MSVKGSCPCSPGTPAYPSLVSSFDFSQWSLYLTTPATQILPTRDALLSAHPHPVLGMCFLLQGAHVLRTRFRVPEAEVLGPLRCRVKEMTQGKCLQCKPKFVSLDPETPWKAGYETLESYVAW